LEDSELEIIKNNMSKEGRGQVGSQERAIFRVYRVVNDLLNNHAEDLVKLYNDTEKPLLDIAREIYGEKVDKYPDKYISAVGEACRRLVPDEKRLEVRKKRLGRFLTNKIESDPNWYEKVSRLGGEANAQRVTQKDIIKMHRGRGIKEWQTGEREELFELVKDPNFSYTAGNKVPRPDYELIAEFLNEKYHGGEKVRFSDRLVRVNSSDNYHRKDGKGKYKKIEN